MIDRYLYLSHVLETVTRPKCGASAVAARTQPGQPRLSYVMRGIKPHVINGDNPMPMNVTLYSDCDCGAAVPFTEPGEIALYVKTTRPAASSVTPLFDTPEVAMRFGKRRRSEVGAALFALASMP
jgi:hypothetical protein